MWRAPAGKPLALMGKVRCQRRPGNAHEKKGTPLPPFFKKLLRYEVLRLDTNLPSYIYHIGS